MNAARALPAVRDRAADVAGADPRIALSVLLGVVALSAVFVLAACVRQLGWLDAWVMSRFAELRGCHATRGLRRFTNAAPFIGVLLAGTSAVAAIFKGRRADGIAVCVLLAIALFFVQALKLLFERHRPGVFPWMDASDESFPSGHVANAAVCVAAVLRLGPVLRRTALRRVSTALAILFVLAVGWSRLYLGAHWVTDVGAALLLGVAFWAFTVVPTAHATRWAAAAMALVVLPGLYVATASGGRIRLHSPASFRKGVLERSAWHVAERMDAAGGGTFTLIPDRSESDPPFVRVTGPTARLAFESRLPGHDVLKIIARPSWGVPHDQCARLGVVVDGTMLATPPLHPTWRSYAVALPALGPGPHQVALRVLTKGQPPAADVATLGVALVSLDR